MHALTGVATLIRLDLEPSPLAQGAAQSLWQRRHDIWRWKMNTARAMGNSRDPGYVPDLIRAWGENTDARVLVMVAWAMGRIGGTEARNALNGFLAGSEGQVREELVLALEAS